MVLLGLLAAACGGGSSATALSTPGPAAAPTLNLAGAWSGTLTINGFSVPVTWTATQTGSNAIGPYVQPMSFGDGQVNRGEDRGDVHDLLRRQYFGRPDPVLNAVVDEAVTRHIDRSAPPRWLIAGTLLEQRHLPEIDRLGGGPHS